MNNAMNIEKKPILQVDDLVVTLHDRLDLIQSVSFTLYPAETLAIVGESGSGKSLTAQALIKLFHAPGMAIKRGSVIFDGVDLASLSSYQMRHYLGTDIAIIAQNPLQALNPTLTIGFQIVEAALHGRFQDKEEAKAAACAILQQVGLSDAARRYSSYPHELSGGMRQRVLIAMALINQPKILIADEPTTALDVTMQAEILNLLRDLKQHMKMALIFITHDLGVVAEIADKVAVMYGGKIVEEADVYELFRHPRHPYTKGLLAAIPSLREHTKPLIAIPGNPPACGTTSDRCAFYERCTQAEKRCTESEPALIQLGPTRSVRCFRETSS